MIITCEQCNARYLLASLLLGESGRKVRCGVCGHTWFQEQPEPELTREEADRASFADMLSTQTDAIPEGVRPIPEGSGMPALQQGKSLFDKEGVMGACAAFLVLVVFSALLASVLYVWREPVVRIWPPAALAYDLVGIPVPVAGEGLALDRIQAVATPLEGGGYQLTVTGHLINLRQEESLLPDLEGAAGAHTWRVVPDDYIEHDTEKDNKGNRVIGGEEVLPFTMTYHVPSGDIGPDIVGDVTIRLVQPEG